MNKVKEGIPGILIMGKGMKGKKQNHDLFKNKKQNMTCLDELQVISVLLDSEG